MNDSTHSGLEPGPLLTSDAGSGARSEPRLFKFSHLTHAKSKSPIVNEKSWPAFTDAVLVYDFRENKDGELFSPAELVGGRETHNVQAVHFGVLDLDGEKVPGPNGKKVHGGVPVPEFLEILKLAETCSHTRPGLSRSPAVATPCVRASWCRCLGLCCPRNGRRSVRASLLRSEGSPIRKPTT